LEFLFLIEWLPEILACTLYGVHIIHFFEGSDVVEELEAFMSLNLCKFSVEVISWV
jgi:hypothetical protein